MIQILIRQIAIMFIMMLIGYFAYRSKMITEEGSDSITNVLLKLVTPFLIIKAMMIDFSMDVLKKILLSFAVSAMLLLISILISKLIFRKNATAHFGAAFSNPGFVGVPLVSSVLGDEGIMLGASFLTLLSFLQWTYGAYAMTGDKKMISLKKFLTNPSIIGLSIGMILFLLPVEYPLLVTNLVSSISGLNSPMAMILLGCFLAKMDPKAILGAKTTYLAVFVRLIVIPLISLIPLCFISNDLYMLKMSLYLMAIAPVGANAALFSQLFKKDIQEGTREVCLSTLLCVVTIPMMAALAEFLWR